MGGIDHVQAIEQHMEQHLLQPPSACCPLAPHARGLGLASLPWCMALGSGPSPGPEGSIIPDAVRERSGVACLSTILLATSLTPIAARARSYRSSARSWPTWRPRSR